MLLLALIAFGVPLALSLRDRVDSEVHSQARSQAQVVAIAASEGINPLRLAKLAQLARESAASVRGRVIVVNAAGRLLADSAGARRGRDYASRPEVAAALKGKEEQITRNSETLGTEILATATPVYEHRRVAGAVRITQSIDAINRAVRTSILDVGGLALVVLVLGLIAGALIAAQIARPIRRLDRAARQVAGGDLDATVAVEGSSEQRSLALAFNEMTGRVKRLLRVQQDFVADASHQLRTPLTGLRLRLEALGEELGRDDAAAADVEAAMREIDRLSLIVDELLILSRAGEHELPGERLDLGAAARRAIERWQASAAERGIELEPHDGRRRAGPGLVRRAGPRTLGRRPGRERAALLARRLDRHRGQRPRPYRGARPRPGAGPGRGGGGVRALQPRQRRAAGPERDRPRAADRPRADAAMGWRRPAVRPRGRRPAGDNRAERGGAEPMKLPGSVKWIGLALVGLAIAAGVALAASALTSQQIGISSESLSAGDALAPRSGSNQGEATGGGTTGGETTGATKPETTPAEPTTTEPETAPPTIPVEPQPEPQPEPEDHHSGGDGHGGGGGGGDGGGHGGSGGHGGDD